MLLKLKNFHFGIIGVALGIMTILPNLLTAQENAKETALREEIIAAAREIMESVPYCTLITVDMEGKAYARLMEPFPPEEDLTVWLGTNPKSRKVAQIRANPRVTLFYADPEGAGYVSLMGTAQLVNDPKEKARRWKDSWDRFYPNRDESYLLIKVVPQRIEVVSYPHRLVGDSLSWETPALEFETKR